MLKSRWRPRALWFICVSVFMVLLAACGSSESVTTSPTNDASESGSPSIEEIAEANEALLQPSDDVTTFEVLNVRDGSISSLSEVVTGDRPVLVWFWSPH